MTLGGSFVAVHRRNRTHGRSALGRSVVVTVCVKTLRRRFVEMVVQHSGTQIVLCCESAAKLRNQSGCRRYQLIDGHTLTRTSYCDGFRLVVSNLASPWTASGFAVEAAGADGHMAMGESLGNDSTFCHLSELA